MSAPIANSRQAGEQRAAAQAPGRHGVVGKTQSWQHDGVHLRQHRRDKAQQGQRVAEQAPATAGGEVQPAEEGGAEGGTERTFLRSLIHATDST